MANEKDEVHNTKSHNSGLDEALKLLNSWGLPELRGIFQEQEISIRALKYLTDDEINQLITKIGPRTIFRAMLREWREEHGYGLNTKQAAKPAKVIKRKHEIAYTPTVKIPVEHIAEQNDPIATKTESDNDLADVSDEWFEERACSEDDSLLDAVDNFYKSDISSTPIAAPKKKVVHRELSGIQEYTEERFNVYLLLSNRKEGRDALDYYHQNDCLDLKNRKNVVKIIISAIVERHIEKYTALFDDITNQILCLFPNEKYEAYYVPHSGTRPARGALYYKYSNYTRQLRKDGLMEYKMKRFKPNNTK